QEEKGKIVSGEDAAKDEVPALRRLRAEIAERDACHHEGPEEPSVDWPVARRPHLRGVEPRHEEEYSDRANERDHAEQLVGNGAQDRIEGQEVPFGHDMRRGL